MLQHSAEMMLLFLVEAPWKDQANQGRVEVYGNLQWINKVLYCSTVLMGVGVLEEGCCPTNSHYFYIKPQLAVSFALVRLQLCGNVQLRFRIMVYQQIFLIFKLNVPLKHFKQVDYTAFLEFLIYKQHNENSFR